jgi:hypothetical protein
MKTALEEKKTGSVMIFAVLLMSAGVFVLAAVLQLAATQGVSGEAEWAALDRRVTLGNSRSMAREYMLSRIFRGSVPANTNQPSVSFNDARGGFTITPAGGLQQDYWTALSTTNTDVVLNINPFNLMERGGFYREIFQGDLLDGNTSTDGVAEWSFALRTRSPIAAGYSFAQQRPANNNLASLANPPYIDMGGNNEQFFGFYGLPRVPMASVTNVMTRGTGDTNGYQGYLDVPPGASVFGIFPNVGGVQFHPRGANEMEARLDLSVQDPNVANSVLRYDVPATASPDTNADGLPDDLNNDGVPDPPLSVHQVTLLGTDLLRKPLHVVAETNQTTLEILTLSGNNSRRVYFYRARPFGNNAPLFTVDTINADSWRLGISLLQCGVQFQIGSLEVIGGLRTDGDIVFQGGSANFIPEEDPGGLDFIADRMMWLEDYRAQQ